MTFSFFKALSLLAILLTSQIFAENQTNSVSPIHSAKNVPFDVEIQEADFILPVGLKSYVFATYNDKILIIAGQTSNMTSLGRVTSALLPETQNQIAYVVNPKKKTVVYRSLAGPGGLKQWELDLISVTSAQSYQTNNTLYVNGGYGYKTFQKKFTTKPSFMAINVPGLIKWVTNPEKYTNAGQFVRETFHQVLPVTGGYMARGEDDQALLMFGQDYSGKESNYGNGNYTEQVRVFKVVDNGSKIEIHPQDTELQQPSYHRRDLNVAPIFLKSKYKDSPYYVALGGGFTTTNGIWNVPILINKKGQTVMADPLNPKTFKQSINIFNCASFSLYDKTKQHSYVVLLGGRTYQYVTKKGIKTDPSLPYTNQIGVIHIDNKHKFTQHILSSRYPTIRSQGVNPGNRLFFGANAHFIPSIETPLYSHGAIKLHRLNKRTLIGYVIGGIQSTLANPLSQEDTAATHRIFKVFLTPKKIKKKR